MDQIYDVQRKSEWFISKPFHLAVKKRKKRWKKFQEFYKLLIFNFNLENNFNITVPVNTK